MRISVCMYEVNKNKNKRNKKNKKQKKKTSTHHLHWTFEDKKPRNLMYPPAGSEYHRASFIALQDQVDLQGAIPAPPT